MAFNYNKIIARELLKQKRNKNLSNKKGKFSTVEDLNDIKFNFNKAIDELGNPEIIEPELNFDEDNSDDPEIEKTNSEEEEQYFDITQAKKNIICLVDYLIETQNEMKSIYINKFKCGNIKISGVFTTNDKEKTDHDIFQLIDILDDNDIDGPEKTKSVPLPGTTAGFYIELAEFLILKTDSLNIKHVPLGSNNFPDYKINSGVDEIYIDSKASKASRSQNSLGVYSGIDYQKDINILFANKTVRQPNTFNELKATLSHFFSFIVYFHYNDHGNGEELDINKIVIAPTIQILDTKKNNNSVFAKKNAKTNDDNFTFNSNLNYNNSFYNVFKNILIPVFIGYVKNQKMKDEMNNIIEEVLKDCSNFDINVEPAIKDAPGLSDSLSESIIKPKLISIKNVLFEGGKAISGAEHIRGDYAMKIANKVMAEVNKKFPEYKMEPLGSTGKKGADSFSGDIDIAISMPFEDVDKLLNFVKETWPNAEINLLPGLNVLSIGYHYKDFNDEDKIVQVDFMFETNLEYADFMYHSPNFINHESDFKGLYRTVLLNNIASQTPLDKKEFPNEYFHGEFEGKYDGELKSFWKYTLSHQEGTGLSIVHKTYEGKKGILKAAKKTGEQFFVTNNINEILKIILGPKAKISDTNSFESLVNYLCSNKYIYKSKEQLEKIFSAYLNDERIVKVSPPETLMKAQKYIKNALKNN